MKNVSRTINRRVYKWFATFTHVTIAPVRCPVLWSSMEYTEMPLNLVLFTSPYMRTIYLKDPIIHPDLVSFLARHCKIRVLVAPQFDLSVEALRQLNKHLRYFVIREVLYDPSSHWQPGHMLGLFPRLLAFDIEKPDDVFCSKLFNERRGHVRWEHSCWHNNFCQLELRPLPLRSKSISWNLSDPLFMSLIGKELAQSVEVLKAQRFSMFGDCKPLPNLLSIVNTKTTGELNRLIQHLYLSPNLRHVNLVGQVDTATASILTTFSSACKKLRSFIFQEDTEGHRHRHAPIFFDLGTEVIFFKFSSSIPLIFNKFFSTQLRTLDVKGSLRRVEDFFFPNLRHFKLNCEFTNSDVCWIFESLQNSPRLEYLHVSFQEDSEYSCVTLNSLYQLIDLIGTLRQLVILEAELELCPEDQMKQLKTFEFTQSYFPRLQKCILALPMETSLVISDSFRTIHFNHPSFVLAEFLETGDADEALIQLDLVNQLTFLQPMTKLEKIYFRSWHCIISHWEVIVNSCRNIEKLVLTLGHDEVHQASEFGALTTFISAIKPKRTRIRWCRCKLLQLLVHLYNWTPFLTGLSISLSKETSPCESINHGPRAQAMAHELLTRGVLRKFDMSSQSSP